MAKTIPERVLVESARQATRLRRLLEIMERQKVGYREAQEILDHDGH